MSDPDLSRTAGTKHKLWACRECTNAVYASTPPEKCPACEATSKDAGCAAGTRLFESV